ncbi:MAG: hypothetical protein RL757_3019 [Bacteroidota bacterium]
MYIGIFILCLFNVTVYLVFKENLITKKGNQGLIIALVWMFSIMIEMILLVHFLDYFYLEVKETHICSAKIVDMNSYGRKNSITISYIINGVAYNNKEGYDADKVREIIKKTGRIPSHLWIKYVVRPIV